MLNDSIDIIANKLVMLTGVCLFLTIFFVIVFLFKIRTKRSDYFSTIRTAQKLRALICSALIWGICGVSVGLMLWFLLFIILRKWFFKTDERRLYMLYLKYEYHGKPYPLIEHVTQWKDAFFLPIPPSKAESQFKYQFSQHIDSCASLLLLWSFRIVDVSQICFPIYALEFLVIATAIYVFVGKTIYKICLNNPSSLFYLSPGLSYIPVIFTGIVYYYIAVVILIMSSN